MRNNEYLPLLRVSGTNYEIGYQIGKAFEERIKKTFKESEQLKLYKQIDKDNPERLDYVEILTKRHFPQYMKEIEGISDGSSIDFRDIFIANCRHVPEKDDVIENCSTIILNKSNEILLAHNEDFESVVGKYSYLMIARSDNGIGFFAHAYPGCIPGNSFGFNSHGMIMTLNSLMNPVKRIGISRLFHGRSVLEAKNIEDAIQRAQTYKPRSGGVSYNLVSMNENRAVNLETTTDDACLTEINDVFFHTNHQISIKFKDKVVYQTTSKQRYERIEELLLMVEKNGNGALKILSDKHIFMDSLKAPTGFFYDTICTLLFEISDTINLKLYPPQIVKKRELRNFSLKDIDF